MVPRKSITRDDEYEIFDDEYEVMPLNPLRRLERRLEALEQSRTLANLEKFIDKIIDMTELNQKIIEEVVKSNQGLREEIEVLVGKLERLEEKIEQFVDVLKMLGEEEAKSSGEEIMVKVLDKFNDVAEKITESNNNMLQMLASIEKRLKKLTTENILPHGGIHRTPPSPASVPIHPPSGEIGTEGMPHMPHAGGFPQSQLSIKK